jgi:hypothetical protein
MANTGSTAGNPESKRGICLGGSAFLNDEVLKGLHEECAHSLVEPGVLVSAKALTFACSLQQTATTRIEKHSQVRGLPRYLTVLFLLASILSISQLARTSAYFSPSTLSYRILRLNRIAEPSTHQTGQRIKITRSVMSRVQPAPTVAVRVFAPFEASAPLFIHFHSSNQFRSPPAKA